MQETSVNELIQSPAREWEEFKKSIFQDLHMALPGIVVAFDADTQTATIQLAVRTRKNGRFKDIPLLTDVPVFFPGGTMFTYYFPVVKGDECLVIFADACIDAWYQTGNVGNPVSVRQHDYSDAFAFVGFRSYPKRMSETPETAAAQWNVATTTETSAIISEYGQS